MTPEDSFFYALITWMGLTAGSYIGIRAYLYSRGEPTGWRMNDTQASAFPGHISFYEREGGNAVVLRAVHLFPLFWRVRVTPGPGKYNSLETAKRGPVWSAVPWAYRYMSNHFVLSTMSSGGGHDD